ILSSLNDLQLTAVTSPTSEPLQIRAGPGTGKTKVLVARVAYLLLHQRISPQNIIVTTFTRKAAREMVERLAHLLGGTDAAPEKLLIGTFHSIGYRVIQKYGALEGLVGFAVAGDNDASQAIESVFAHDITDTEWAQIAQMPPADLAPFVARAIDPADPADPASSETHAERSKLDRKKLLRHISKLKARALFPDDYARLSGRNILLSLVYTKYQHRLYTHRLLDFDDCLLYCHRIVTRHPVLRFVQHTLVDEFQDTNEIQLQLMYQFAARGTKTKPRYCVTIVGDQDQSIYAFRDAQARNFDLMLQHYRDNHSLHCRTVNLTQNYRSTADILRLSEHVMRQQPQRPRKDLVSQLLHTLRPVKAVLSSADEEARWVAHQIESLAALPSRPLGYAEMAVLVRSAYQTRVLESEFVRRKIPYAIVKGRAFWKRKEVMSVLDYLRCVADDHDWLALFRCINFPKRGVGPVAVAELERICEQQAGARRVPEDIDVQLTARAPRVSAPALCFDILQKVGLREIKTSLGVKVLGAVKEFVGAIQETRLLLERGFDGPELRAEVVAQAFDHLLVRTRLDKEFCADENHMLIFHEVRSQLVLFLIPEAEESLPDYTDTESATFIRQFLTLVVLYETDSAAEQRADVPKVAISTIHGAKGLEWPVVFVPGVSEGLLPASFALTGEEEAVNEERRCFYVAATRAKLLLFVSAYTETAGGLKWGRPPIERPSRFL
ncbi:P-loop containing nucleoside triphosphate hydrolase protein, partial [Metschnikowia bicuspidata]